MNTIPTIFNEHKIPYTILGKNAGTTEEKISVVVLNRGARYYLASLFQNLISMGLTSIVFVENSTRSFELETLSTQFPEVKFIVPSEEVSAGEMINLGISEVFSDYVLVIWNDMVLPSVFQFENLIEKLEEKQIICAAPFLISSKNSAMPIQNVPSLMGKEFSTEQFLCKKDFTKTIYMSDFTGIYNRLKFIEAGGFDYTIKNPYWQNLDFCFRAHLCGNEIMIFNILKIKYTGDFPIEDISADNSYMTFYLKNLAPAFGKNGMYLPGKRFFHYAKQSGLNIFKAYKYFKHVSLWVNVNRYKFTVSPSELISNWEPSI
ncbi:hypothetical protein [Treponema pedis]|uniref:Glycosyltransferase n=1 Tax=Treponema pedis TaxID=409322 RepID=A0A7S7AVW9_9SPIR|nr:hypothetical protein [Treponema pedis]QOW60021.1 hypothetical protein IFE08_09180 [Treponema pedis]